MNLSWPLRVVLALAVALLALPAAAEAAPVVQVSCGETITTDVKLANDLIDCPNEGIIIGADGITVDLNGHTVDGDAAPVEDCPEVEPCDVGIVNAAHNGPQPVNGPGHSGVTFKNGTVREFDVGFYGFGVRSNRLQSMTFSNHAFHGVLFVRDSADNVVEGSRFSGNPFPAVVLDRSSRNRIQRNSLLNNDEGIHLFEGSTGNVIEGNTLAGHVFAGIVVEASGNTVSLNRLFDNGDGIVVFGDSNSVSENQIVDTVGCPDGCGLGIVVDGGIGNVISRNLVTRATGDGILLAAGDPDTPTIETVVRENRVVNAGGDGLAVATVGEGAVTGARLEANLATGAGDDGFDVRSPGTTLTANTALRNADLGIAAVPGVLDGGGNRASGNGNPLQCVGVACGP